MAPFERGSKIEGQKTDEQKAVGVHEEKLELSNGNS